MHKEKDDKNTIEIIKNESGSLIRIGGAWTVSHLPAEERAIHTPLASVASGKPLTIDGSSITQMDTSGAWLIIEFLRKLTPNGETITWQGFSDSHQKLLDMVRNLKHLPLPVKNKSYFYNLFIDLGKFSLHSWRETFALIAFFGQLSTTFGLALLHPGKFRFKSIIFHINQVGIEAIPIIAVMSFLISIVLGYQGAEQLGKFGASIYAINLVAISMLRDMGVLITAIMLAGRSGSAFAAQIGVMQMNDEIAAMRTIGLDPFELLIMPRIIAIIIVLPALTFISDIVGLLGTMFISNHLLDISPVAFISKIRTVVDAHKFYVGLLKAPVFALCIGVAGCLQGMQVRISATELGERTTMAVVQSIFLVILGDAAFSVLFRMLGI